MPDVYLVPKVRHDMWESFGVVLRHDDFEDEVLMMLYNASLTRRQIALDRRRE